MFDLEMERVIEEVNNRESKRVLIQLPDGLKSQADEVVKTLEEKTNAEILIWLSSCYGACDVPLGLESMKIDLMIQWGHNRFHKEMW